MALRLWPRLVPRDRTEMDERVRDVTLELADVAAAATTRCGELSAAQLNWKPAPNRWSIAQCFDHLITTHSLYLPLLRALQAGRHRSSFWERHSPLSGFFGRFLINALRPDNLKPMKTTSKAAPSTSEIDGRIIERYRAHQDELIRALCDIPAELDPRTTIITSPLLGLITYSLDDCFTILVVHSQRHLGQATRVTETAGFP